MSLADHTRSIIALAWSRILGLEDHELQGEGSPHEVLTAEDSEVTLLRLFGHTVLSGPARLLREARRLDHTELADERRLLELARRHAPGARGRGAAALLYAEEPPTLHAAQRGAVSFDPGHVRAALAASPADDVRASGIQEAPWTAALIEDDSGTVLGAAGRELWAGMLGQLGVLTVPDRRRSGVGLHLAAVAAEEAFTEGLVPQWRARTESVGSQRIAAALGFSPAGSQTTVVLH